MTGMADAVKDTYRQTATAEDRLAYWGVWWRQLCRWPTEYLDAALHMNGLLFDLRDNEPMYISFSDMALDTYVYPWSFNDMTMYDREALVPLSSAQRALTEWYMDFDRLPLIGLCASMSFNVLLTLALFYLCATGGRRGILPGVFAGAGNALGVPVFPGGLSAIRPAPHRRYAGGAGGVRRAP